MKKEKSTTLAVARDQAIETLFFHSGDFRLLFFHIAAFQFWFKSKIYRKLKLFSFPLLATTKKINRLHAKS